MIREPVSLIGDAPAPAAPRPLEPPPEDAVLSLQEARQRLAAPSGDPEPPREVKTRRGCRWGHETWWRGESGKWICGVCHPPASEHGIEWHNGDYPGD